MAGHRSRLAALVLTLGLLLPCTLALAQPASVEVPAESAPEASGDRAAPTDAVDVEAEVEAPPELPPLVVRGNELLFGLNQLRMRFETLGAGAEEAEGDDRRVLDHQIAEAKIEYLATMNELVANLLAQEEAGLDAVKVREFVVQELRDLRRPIVRHIEESEEALRELRKLRVSAEPAELDELEDRISEEVSWLDSLLESYVGNYESLTRVGLDASQEKRDIQQRLSTRADRLAGRIELTTDKLRRLEERLLGSPEDAAIQEEVRLATRRKALVIETMTNTVALMKRVDMDSSDYSRLLIKSTGEVTVDVFSSKVIVGLAEEALEWLREWARATGPGLAVKSLIFAAILVGFRILALVTQRLVKRGVRRQSVKTSQLLNNMMLGLASRCIMLLGLLVALSSLGIELGPLLAGLGIAGFIVGFALQDSLANFAAGMMILGYQPYDVDDVIEAGGVFGTVSHMSLVSTTILTFDNQTLIVPNAKIWGDVIKNVTNQRVRRVDLEVQVSRDEDVDEVERVLRALLAEHPKVLEEPAPNVRLHKLQEGSLLFVVRPWVETGDYWEVYWDLTSEIKRRFDAEGITIPYPQREVHLKSDRAARPSAS